MKHTVYALVLTWVLFLLSLSGCGVKSNPYLCDIRVTENWQCRIMTHPQIWKDGADRWFLSGDTDHVQAFDRSNPADYAMSTMSVAVPNFTSLRIDGGFQTQIYGTSGRNKVDLYGPNAGVSSVNVEVLEDTVLIHARPDADPAITKVIVRIGVQDLRHLVQMGCGPIDAIQLQTDDFRVETTGSASGDLYLAGHINLHSVNQAGSSTIHVFGVDSRSLTVTTCGYGGGVNLFGRVGVRSITHNGSNDINIIGANSSSLTIMAGGAGKVGVKGFVRLHTVEAHDNAEVYVSNSASRSLCVSVYDCARVGIAGSTGTLHAYTSKSGRFWGKSLCALNAYAVSKDVSHINITASNKAYAKAYDSSSIYFFGPDYLLDSFQNGRGLVMATGERNYCNRYGEFRSYDYTDTHAQRPCFVGAG